MAGVNWGAVSPSTIWWGYPNTSSNPDQVEADLQGWQGFRSWAWIRSHAETTIIPGKSRAPVKKIGSSDSIFGLVNSTYFFKSQTIISMLSTSNIQQTWLRNIEHVSAIRNWQIFRWPPSWKICLRIQLSFGFGGRAVKAFVNFSWKLAWLLKTLYLKKFWSTDLSPRFSKLEI